MAGRQAQAASSSNHSKESVLSEAVTLLERSMCLLRDSPVTTVQHSPTHIATGTKEERAAANYRNIYPGQSTSTSLPCPSAPGTSGVGSTASTSQSFTRWPNASVCRNSSMNQTSLASISKKKFRFQPYKMKESWTHDFCVLADKDQRKVPATLVKQELREAGLGQKNIVFKNKKGDFTHIQEVLYSHFPKLKEAGGFELYRQGTGKSLSYIKPPASGYTIPFLKYGYVIKSAILYVLPIQRNLSAEPVPIDEEEVDDNNIQMQDCYECGSSVPLAGLRKHLETCGSSCSVTADTAKDINVQETVELKDSDSSEDDLPPMHILPSTSNSSSSCQQQDNTLGPEALAQLQAMFPLIPRSGLQSALDTNCIMEDAIEQLLSTGSHVAYGAVCDEKEKCPLPKDLPSLLHQIAPKSTSVKRVTVNRDCLLADSICAFKISKFDFDQTFRITFENESGIDGGGPSREYFSLLLKELVSPSAPIRLFEGQESRLLPMHNTDALRGGLFKVAGRMIASSIINGCPGFPCLAPPAYVYLITGSVDEAVEAASIDDIPDYEMKEVLNKIDNLDDFNEVPSQISDVLVNAGFTKLLTKANKTSAMMSLMINSVITSRKAELDQFAQGLGPVLREARRVPDICKPLFVHDKEMEQLTAEKVKALLDIDLLEDILQEYIQKYIDSKGQDDLERFLMFCTGVSCIPPMGFTNPSNITVTSTPSILPNANTCPMELEIPSGIATFEKFCTQMDLAIEYQATGFGVP